MALDKGGVSGGSRRRKDDGGRFDDAGWNVVGDSNHAVGTIKRPEGGGGGGGGRFAEGPGGRFDVEDLVKLTPYTMPEPHQSKTSYENFLPKDAPVHKWADGKSITNLVEALDKPRAQKTEQEAKPVTRRTYELTWDQYNKLSEEQRAAVDFNTLLIQAREKDLNTDYEESPQQRETYQKAVEAMFGKHGGSETYAPETMAVLRQIDFQGSEGDDLDNFLGLKSTISAKELKDFTVDPIDVSLNVPVANTTVETQLLGTEGRAAQGVTGLRAKLAKGAQLMADFRASAVRDPERVADLGFFGGQVDREKASLGWGQGSGNPEDPNIHDAFRKSYDMLAARGSNPEQILGWLGERLRPDEMQAFMAYADERSGQARQYGLELGEVPKVKYRAPEEFRKMLGLDKGV